MSALHPARQLFFASLALLAISLTIGTIRNPRGIPDSSGWNVAELVILLVGFSMCLASPFLSDRAVRAKLLLSLAAGAAYVLVLLFLVLVHFVVFGPPVQP
jgi:hypothetical protein